jgi:hypothetical protein
MPTLGDQERQTLGVKMETLRINQSRWRQIIVIYSGLSAVCVVAMYVAPLRTVVDWGCMIFWIIGPPACLFFHADVPAQWWILPYVLGTGVCFILFFLGSDARKRSKSLLLTYAGIAVWILCGIIGVSPCA